MFLTKPTPQEAAAENQTVLSLWHIDTFEGGKGSRAKFLSKVAKGYEKKDKGLYIMITTYTPTGASEALLCGETPDMLSFSCGVDGVAERCRKLDYHFQGGEIGGNFYAYPWCRGQYYLFSLTDDFSSVTADNVVLSKGGNNLPTLAWLLNGRRGEVTEQNSTAAYVQFLNGKYGYMLGTQRDIYRFQTRGVTVYAQPMPAFNDLYQYISITTKDEKNIARCNGFLRELLSQETQRALGDIGMYSVKEDESKRTLSPFTDGAGLQRIDEAIKGAIKTGEIKILESYLKALN